MEHRLALGALGIHRRLALRSYSRQGDPVLTVLHF
jgi:hypothetical protein